MAGVPKLIVLSELLRGKSYELSKDLYTCGRDEDRDICIIDPTISTYHCDFVRTGTSFTIRDHGSTNGSRVNNIPVKEQELQNSDILQLGGVEVLYDCESKSVTTVMRTQTGIDLTGVEVGTTTVRQMENFSPFEAERKKYENKSSNFIKILIVLVIIIIGLLAVIVKNILFS